MATAEQLKALIRAHFDEDSEKFKTVALLIADHEAKVGHASCAKDIMDFLESIKNSKKKEIPSGKKMDILEQRNSYVDMFDIVLSDYLESKVKRIIKEFKKKEILRNNGLKHRSRILLTGELGTGKTMTASVIANEVNLPLYVIKIDKLLTKYMGEAKVKLRQVFQYVEDFPGVYLFDEFESIGSDRCTDNNVRELRRILNSFLKYTKDENLPSLIIVATNNPSTLEMESFKRFDDVLEYYLPDEKQILRIMKNKLEGHSGKDIYEKEVVDFARGLSHSDISKACEEALKHSIMDEVIIDKKLMIGVLQSRRYFS